MVSMNNGVTILIFSFLLTKACVHYFFIFTPNSPSKTMKNVFYFTYRALFVLKMIKFLWFSLLFHKTLRSNFDHPLKQWTTGKKRGEDRNTKIWISWEQKKLFR